MAREKPLVLLTGATGYIGGRLLPLLEHRGVRLRCLARRPENLRPRAASTTEVVSGDVLASESLPPALDGVDTAYYLIHSMGTARDFERDDRQAAANFATVARQAGVRRIIYLGGLGNPKHGLSGHLRSRQETGEVLRASGVPVIEFRASIIMYAETRWSDALSSGGVKPRWGGVRFGSRIVDSRTATVHVPAETAFAPIQRIGGKTGWYFGNWLWRLRGMLDRFVGGVGLRRGRRDAVDLRVGEALDFWRVEAFEPGHLLRLQAEMKLPGRAWLEFEVTAGEESSTIRQTAIFDPLGLLGLAYWYSLYPLHRMIFAGMLRALVRAAE
jgi:hypothetical protein